MKHFFPPPMDESPAPISRRRDVSTEEYLQEVQPLYHKVVAAFEKLQNIVSNNGTTILIAWRRMTKTQRQSLLLRVRSDIPKQHAHDLDTWLALRWRNLKPAILTNAQGRYPDGAKKDMLRSDPGMFFRFAPEIMDQFDSAELNKLLMRMVEAKHLDIRNITKLIPDTFKRLSKRYLKKVPVNIRDQLDSNKPQWIDTIDVSSYGMLLCSFLNVEDLVKGDILPLFIQTRAHINPDIFTRSDLYQATLSIDTMPMTLLQAVEHQLVLSFSKYNQQSESESRDSQGLLQLVDLPINEMLKARFLFPIHGGHLVLEAQGALYPFLVDCCKEISRLVSSADIVNSVGVVLSPSTTKKRSSLAVEMTEAPYRVPAALNLQHLEDLIFGQRSAAEDHIWSLREDPNYFQKTAEAYYEHQKHFLPLRGIDNGLDTLDRTTKLRKNGLQKMISSAYNIHELWSVAHEQIVELRRLEIAHRDQIRDDFPLPEPLLIAFLRLYIFLGRGCNIFGPITATISMTSLQSVREDY
jgi:hypothetical protein